MHQQHFIKGQCQEISKGPTCVLDQQSKILYMADLAAAKRKGFTLALYCAAGSEISLPCIQRNDVVIVFWAS
jgi:hypothetical protein